MTTHSDAQRGLEVGGEHKFSRGGGGGGVRIINLDRELLEYWK